MNWNLRKYFIYCLIFQIFKKIAQFICNSDKRFSWYKWIWQAKIGGVYDRIRIILPSNIKCILKGDVLLGQTVSG